MVEEQPNNGQVARRGYSPTLTMYLAQRLLVTLVLTTIVLGLFAYLMDVLEMLRQVSGRDVTTGRVLAMSLMKLPDLMQTMLPFAVLLASMVTLQQLNRSNELVALRASGLPARRFLLGPMAVILMTGLVALFIFNPLTATLLKGYEHWRGEVFPDSTRGLVTAGGSIWMRQQEKGYEFFIYGANINATAQVLRQATVFVFDPEGSFRARIDAADMVLEPGRWRLDDIVMTSENQVVRDDTVYLPTTLTPTMIQSSFNRPGTMNVWELRRFIDVLHATGLPAEQHEMLFQRLLAMPAFLLAMFWLAIPFTLRYVRQGGLGVAIGAGLGMGFGFYLFSNYVATFGLAGRLDITLAAWTPTLIAALIATAMLIQLREE